MEEQIGSRTVVLKVAISCCFYFAMNIFLYDREALIASVTMEVFMYASSAVPPMSS